MCTSRKRMGNGRFLYGWFFAVIQTGTIAAVGVAFAKLRLLVCAFK
jgi:hypothetical protein